MAASRISTEEIMQRTGDIQMALHTIEYASEDQELKRKLWDIDQQIFALNRRVVYGDADPSVQYVDYRNGIEVSRTTEKPQWARVFDRP